MKKREIILISILVIAISLLLFWLQYPASFVDLSDDQQNICNYASGIAHGEYFVNDPFLKDLKHFSYWSPFFLQLLNYLQEIFGSYANAFLVITPFISFPFMLGMYIFCRQQGLSIIFAFCLSVGLGIVQIPFPLGGDWALWRVYGAVPKNLTIAFLPWTLILIYYVREKPMLWPLFGVLITSLFYIHGVLPPIWGISILWALLLTCPPTISLGKKYLMFFITIIVATILVFPGLSTYLHKGNVLKLTSEENSQITNIALSSMYIGYYSLLKALRDFLKEALKYQLLWPVLVLILAFIHLIKAKTSFNRKLIFTIIMVVSILNLAWIITLLDKFVANILGQQPILLDIIRNWRFWPFLMILIVIQVYPYLQEKNMCIARHNFKMNKILCFSLLITLLSLLPVTINGELQRYSLYTENQILKKDKVKFKQHTEELVMQVQNLVPKGELIWAQQDWIRHTTLRPNIHSPKNGGDFLYSDVPELLNWWEKEQAIRTAKKLSRDPEERTAKFLLLAKSWRVKYIILSLSQFSIENLPKHAKILFANNYWGLLQINNIGNN